MGTASGRAGGDDGDGAACKPKWDTGGVDPVDGRKHISVCNRWERTHLSVGEVTRYPRYFSSTTGETRTIAAIKLL